jgi:hypothetical protein
MIPGERHPNHRGLRWNEDDGNVATFQTESFYANGHSRKRLFMAGSTSLYSMYVNAVGAKAI